MRHLEVYPWEWTPAMADEWFAELRGVRHLARSTLRGYQVAIRGFCGFITDPAYGWAQVCEEQFGTHPIQMRGEANAAKRAFTRDELQALFHHADDQVAQKRGLGRKGWWAAFRDATIFKTAYGYGTRRRETAMLDMADFGRNPDGQEQVGHDHASTTSIYTCVSSD